MVWRAGAVRLAGSTRPIFLLTKKLAIIHPAPTALKIETARMTELKIWIFSGEAGAESTAIFPRHQFEVIYESNFQRISTWYRTFEPVLTIRLPWVSSWPYLIAIVPSPGKEKLQKVPDSVSLVRILQKKKLRAPQLIIRSKAAKK